VPYVFFGVIDGSHLSPAVMISMELVGLALGRLFCAISRTQVMAKSVVSVATLLFSTVAGFMPKYGQIPRIFRWMSWLSPPAYGFEALAINEYVGRTLTFGSVSRGSLDVELGTLPGEDWLKTLQIPRIEWGSYEEIKITNILMLLILAIVTDIVGLALMERSRRNFFSQLRRPQRFSKSLSFIADNGKGGIPDPVTWPASVTISDLCYFVPLKRESAPKRCSPGAIFGPLLLGGKKGKSEIAKTKAMSELQLLTSVSAVFRAGRATALMGTSGAGYDDSLTIGYRLLHHNVSFPLTECSLTPFPP
jgi:ATP-binding cassette, subfamily G (WHITE), member 2, PDR